MPIILDGPIARVRHALGGGKPDPFRPKAEVKEALERGATQVILDLEGLDFIDSTGIGQILSSHMSTSRGGGEMHVVNVAPAIRDLLRLMNIGKVVNIEGL